MSPERQKGRCYYRCQHKGCPTTTVREDRLEEAIKYRLRRLQIEPENAHHLAESWAGKAVAKQSDDAADAIRLRIVDEENRLERLTDLFVDGAIDNDTYQKRRQKSRLRLVELREQRAEMPDQAAIERNRTDFLELMKSLCLLYEMAKPDEKREIVENAFSNRVVAGKNVELEPYDWLRQPESMPSVFQCDPERYRDTDLPGVPAGVRGLQKLISVNKKKSRPKLDGQSGEM